MAESFDILDRAAATRSVNESHQGEPEITRHHLGKNHLVADRAVVSTAAYGEIVADHDNRPLPHTGTTDDHIRRGDIDQVAIGIVLPGPRQPTHFTETFRIHQLFDALANGQLAAFVLTANLLLAPHLQRERLASCKFVEFRRPAHVVWFLWSEM